MAEEAALQSKMHAWLKEQGIYHFKVIVSSKSGVPDIVACVGGSFVGIEMKSSRGKLSKLQEVNRERIRESYGFYFECSPKNFDEIKSLIMSLHKES